MAIAKHAGFLVKWSGILFSFYPGACLSLDQIPEFLHILWPVCEMEGTLSASYFSSLECVYVLYINIKCFDPSGKLKGVWQYLLHISLLLLQLQSIFTPLRLSQSLLLADTVLLSTKHVLENHVWTHTVLLPFLSPPLLQFTKVSNCGKTKWWSK